MAYFTPFGINNADPIPRDMTVGMIDTINLMSAWYISDEAQIIIDLINQMNDISKSLPRAITDQVKSAYNALDDYVHELRTQLGDVREIAIRALDTGDFDADRQSIPTVDQAIQFSPTVKKKRSG